MPLKQDTFSILRGQVVVWAARSSWELWGPRGYQPKSAARLRSSPKIHIEPDASRIKLCLAALPYHFVFSLEID